MRPLRASAEWCLAAVDQCWTQKAPKISARELPDVAESDKQQKKEKRPAPATGVDLEAYSAHYSNQPWGSESVLLPWAGGLAFLRLPSAEPAGDIVFLKPKGGDVFRRVREDGSEAEEFKFQRDASGKVTGFMHFSNPTFRLADEANVRQ